MRESAEIANAGVDVELAVRRDAQEAVEAVRAGRVIALADTDAGHLATVALARAGLLLVPVEHPRALVERLLDEGRRDRAAVRADLAARVRRIGRADRNAVDAELACRLVHDWLDRGRELVLARPALRARGWRVGENRHGAIAHGGGLVEEREAVAGRAEVAGALMRAGLLHDVEVGGQNLAVGRKAELEAALEARPRTADRIFLGAGDAVHHRAVDLLRHQSGDRHVGIAGNLAAEATAAELRDQDEILRLNTDQARDVGDGRSMALVRAMQDALAAFPVGEGRARLHAVMRKAAGDEALVDHQLCRLEPLLDVAVFPLFGGLAGRQLVVAGRCEVARLPLQRLEVDLGGSDIAVRARIGPAREQALQRISDMRKLLE